jgi:peptidoglycan/LPS O-acetylase OafA/YrhL
VARFARIYPLHVITLVAAAGMTLIASGVIPKIGTLLTNITLTKSWLPLKEFFFSYNAPSWSISDEMFFYLLFPVLLPLLVKFCRSAKRIWIAVIVFIALYIGVAAMVPAEQHHYIFYINPVLRLADFVLGIMLFQLWNRNRSRMKDISVGKSTAIEIIAIALLAVFVTVGVLFIPKVYRYALFYWPVMLFVVYVFAFSRGLVSKLLSSRFFVLAGEISFGFYMLHVIVIGVMGGAIHKLIPAIDDTILKFMIVAVSVFVVSLCSYYWYEKPVNGFIKKKYAMRNRKTAIAHEE